MGVELIVYKEKTVLLKRIFDYVAQIVAQKLNVYIQISDFFLFLNYSGIFRGSGEEDLRNKNFHLFSITLNIL